MKSQIKVDYKSRYGDGDFGDKEPIIRVDVIESEDPRDTLLNEIFRDQGFQKIGAGKISPKGSANDQVIIFRRTPREIWINDLASPIYLGLTKYSGIDAIMVTGHNGIWFELSKDSAVRSDVLSNDFMESLRFDLITDNQRDLKFVERLVEIWKQFESTIKNV